MSNLTAAERSELTILHYTDHHTAAQTERFNDLRSKEYPAIARTHASIKEAREESRKAERKMEIEFADTWTRINAKWGK